MTDQQWDRTLQSIVQAAQRWGHDGRLSYTKIAKESGVHLSAVSRALKDGYATELTRAKLTQWWESRGEV